MGSAVGAIWEWQIGGGVRRVLPGHLGVANCGRISRRYAPTSRSCCVKTFADHCPGSFESRAGVAAQHQTAQIDVSTTEYSPLPLIKSRLTSDDKKLATDTQSEDRTILEAVRTIDDASFPKYHQTAWPAESPSPNSQRRTQPSLTAWRASTTATTHPARPYAATFSNREAMSNIPVYADTLDSQPARKTPVFSMYMYVSSVVDIRSPVPNTRPHLHGT